MPRLARAWFSNLTRLSAFRALTYRDFRVLWVGAFVSFTGSMVQNVAQGYLVYELTGDAAKLAFVMFCAMLPISFVGPFAGFVADLFDKRKVLIWCMVLSSIGPLFLAWGTAAGRVAYWHFIASALWIGLVQCVEVPTRQGIVRQVVDEKDLAAAIPAQASTFNLARIVGPALGGFLAATVGPAWCFLINGLSFSAMALAAAKLKTKLHNPPERREPVKDLLFEGLRFTFRTTSHRTLFLLETGTSVFGTSYLALMPAIAKTKLGLDQRGLGAAMSCVGIGALIGLIVLASLSARPFKTLLVRLAMAMMTLGLFGLAATSSPWVAFPILSVLGACTIVQFNSTNTLFQLLTPEKLRGRVLSMHLWAIGGMAPIGVLASGWIAREAGLSFALACGAAALALTTTVGWMAASKVPEPVFGDAGAA